MSRTRERRRRVHAGMSRHFQRTTRFVIATGLCLGLGAPGSTVRLPNPARELKQITDLIGKRTLQTLPQSLPRQRFWQHLSRFGPWAEKNAVRVIRSLKLSLD
jgi:hypothetical protein